jgi:hypothetical protein
VSSGKADADINNSSTVNVTDVSINVFNIIYRVIVRHGLGHARRRARVWPSCSRSSCPGAAGGAT